MENQDWIFLRFLESYFWYELNKNFRGFLFLIRTKTSPWNHSATACTPNLKYPIKFKLTSYWLQSFLQSIICLDMFRNVFQYTNGVSILVHFQINIFSKTCDRVLSNKRKYIIWLFKIKYAFTHKLRLLAI